MPCGRFLQRLATNASFIAYCTISNLGALSDSRCTFAIQRLCQFASEVSLYRKLIIESVPGALRLDWSASHVRSERTKPSPLELSFVQTDRREQTSELPPRGPSDRDRENARPKRNSPIMEKRTRNPREAPKRALQRIPLVVHTYRHYEPIRYS